MSDKPTPEPAEQIQNAVSARVEGGLPLDRLPVDTKATGQTEPRAEAPDGGSDPARPAKGS